MTPIIVTIVIAIASSHLLLGVIAGILLTISMMEETISVWKVLRIKYRLLFILIIILFFKEIIAYSKIGNDIASFLTALGFHPAILIVLIGLCSGLILGSSKNMVLLSFPLAMPLFPEGQLLSYRILLYISAFAGYMTSPAHTCPTIAREYFEVKLKYFYKHTAIISSLILASGIITFLVMQAI